MLVAHLASAPEDIREALRGVFIDPQARHRELDAWDLMGLTRVATAAPWKQLRIKPHRSGVRRDSTYRRETLGGPRGDGAARQQSGPNRRAHSRTASPRATPRDSPHPAAWRRLSRCARCADAGCAATRAAGVGGGVRWIDKVLSEWRRHPGFCLARYELELVPQFTAVDSRPPVRARRCGGTSLPARSTADTRERDRDLVHRDGRSPPAPPRGHGAAPRAAAVHLARCIHQHAHRQRTFASEVSIDSDTLTVGGAGNRHASRTQQSG